MNLFYPVRSFNVQLQGRSEGKIKSHDSCIDVRAWSHDLWKRDRYLKEWIKKDMSLCVIPLSTLIRLFRAMTCKSKGRVTPQCHPDCRAKVILDSITTACAAVRDCLKDDPTLQKYLCEEELETSHWPYERCLEALKNIKMFWRVLLEKVFAINLRKEECFDQKTNRDCDNVRHVARCWERDMLHQAKFVKTISRQLLNAMEKRKMYCDMPKEGDMVTNNTITRSESTQHLLNRKRNKKSGTDTNKVTVVDAGCGGDDFISEPESDVLRKDIESLNLKLLHFQQENIKLRCELENLNQCRAVQNSLSASRVAKLTLSLSKHDNNIPAPYEDSCSEKSYVKDIDSELVITMKNCQHQSFHHVSMLQVLHKTNCTNFEDDYEGPKFKSEDPVELLTKVQNKLQDMVRREMDLATAANKGTNAKIEATFQRIDPGKDSERFI